MVSGLVKALVTVLKWTVGVVLGLTVLLPVLIVVLVVAFWSSQRPMVVSEEAPVQHITPKIGHPTAAPGIGAGA